MLPRWVKVGVVAAVVLAAVGYWAKPYADDWWLARQACGGAMPDEAVDKLIPGDQHLASEYEYVSKELGTYSCALSYGSRKAGRGACSCVPRRRGA
ncbi:hypothetical protein SLUN_14790 [Streptomyces lunaelactis]|uniref:Uncharacterized protein n=1 Tax=Streptomyces lunaelactis TaxID=1535768 RepID=A0A2R4T2C9_9ACTN|nr:hypothetical protein [Streptomyces lunaelactis]AVZ73262.1 hypothetical protein SLUN_14790 [Streptomyces lunaelactis]NUK86002.1 hypothetical protein [Streptomyces lunaelactis]